MPRYANLVFQGGGVRGIAYAGVLESMPADVEIRGVGGTSAGSLVAALLAIGKRDKLSAILTDDQLFHLLAPEDQARLERLVAAWRIIRPALSVLSGKPGFRQRWSAYRTLYSQMKAATPDLISIWNQRGVNSSKHLRAWLNDVLEGHKFGDVTRFGHVKDLRIVAADVSLHRFAIFRTGQDNTMLLADAVLASCSIPVFFNPYPIGSNLYVDGGILSNFPGFLFAQTGYPTIGFRLEDAPALSRLEDLDARKNVPLNLDSAPEYLWAMLATMMEAHDQRRGSPSSFHSVTIETPETIPATKFDLTQADADALFTKGQAAARKVKWAEWTSRAPVQAFSDPRCEDALRYSLQNSDDILNKLYDRRRWVDRLYQKADFRARIDHTWSTTYTRTGEMRVTGSGAIFGTRLVAVGIPGEATCLVDHLPLWEERDDSGNWKPKPLIPTSNSESTKGFMAVYDPPLQAGQAERAFRTRIAVASEFKQTLADGQPDSIRYRVRRIAHEYELHLTLTIEVDSQLPKLDFVCNFSPPLALIDPNRGDPDGRTYRVYSSEIRNARFEDELYLEVSVAAVPSEGFFRVT